MQKLKQILLAIALLLSVSNAGADVDSGKYMSFHSANDLLQSIQACDYEESHPTCSYARGFIAGLAEGYNALVYNRDFRPRICALRLTPGGRCVAYKGDFRPSICLVEGITKGQLVLVVKEYLESNPALLHYGAGTQSFLALQKAFPCS